MRRSTVEAAPRSMVEDRLSLEAAAALTDVAHMQGRRRREDAKQFIAHDVAMYDVPPPPPALGPPNSSPPTPEAHRHFSAGSPGCQQNRGKYRCGRCGQMKVNHVCPIGRAPLQRSLSVQASAFHACSLFLTFRHSFPQTEPIYLASSLETGAVLTSRPRTPRDRVLTVRRWDVRKRSLCDAAC